MTNPADKGFVLVPVESTTEMDVAGAMHLRLHPGDASGTFQAMLSASPSLLSGEAGEGMEVVAWLDPVPMGNGYTVAITERPLIDPEAWAPLVRQSEAASLISTLVRERDEERDEARAAIATPEAVHANMLRGGIPALSIRQALHLHGEAALATWDQAEASQREVERLREALGPLWSNQSTQ